MEASNSKESSISPTTDAEGIDLMGQYMEVQEQEGNIDDEKQTAMMIGQVVRLTVFPDMKFADDEKLFAYQPTRDEKDPTRGILFRAIKKECIKIGQDEESWWASVRKIVTVALSRKRSSVISSMKQVLLGKNKRIEEGSAGDHSCTKNN